MATNARQKKRTDSVPASAALIGIDADGARHYCTSPIYETVTIYVKEQSGEIDTWDLEETPYDTVGGPDADQPGWYDHVAAKRGWEMLADEIVARQLQTLAGGAH